MRGTMAYRHSYIIEQRTAEHLREGVKLFTDIKQYRILFTWFRFSPKQEA